MRSIALETGGDARAVSLLEEALADEVFAPVDRFEIYANLGRAYAGAGRPDRAAALYEQCLEGVSEAGGDPSLEARYAALLSYALTDMGEIAKAEEVVRHALSRVGDSSDPYMRVRLYWSVARLAHTQGREAVALENVRKAIALLQATDDTFHLARANVLAAEIMLGRSDPTAAEQHLEQAEQLFGGGRTPDDTMEITQLRSRLELLRGNAAAAIAFAREALALCNESQQMERGISAHALADALSLAGEANDASATYKQAVDLLELTGQFRSASTAARSWGRLLREQGQESDALDVLDRAAELGMRATPEGIRAER